MATTDAYFKPLDFTQIAGYPHTLPDKAIEKLPTFQGNNVVTVENHIGKISKCYLSWVRDPTQTHDDVYMKLFALSLEEDACEWYLDLDDNSYANYVGFLKGFKKRWGVQKEPRHQ